MLLFKGTVNRGKIKKLLMCSLRIAAQYQLLQKRTIKGIRKGITAVEPLN